MLGNFDNNLSLVACLQAKEFLAQRFDMAPFDAALKPQGANGLDIDLRTKSGTRIIGEIKTTSVFTGQDFRAAQRQNMIKDFAKLAANHADHTFMFVADPQAFDTLCARTSPSFPMSR